MTDCLLRNESAAMTPLPENTMLSPEEIQRFGPALLVPVHDRGKKLMKFIFCFTFDFIFMLSVLSFIFLLEKSTSVPHGYQKTV